VRKMTMLVVALAVVAAACSSGSSAGSCDKVADDAVAAIQNMIDQFDAMSPQELADLGDNAPQFQEIDQKMSELEQQAKDLGCSDSEMNDLVAARLDRLTAKGDFGKLILEQVKSSDAPLGN